MRNPDRRLVGQPGPADGARGCDDLEVSAPVEDACEPLRDPMAPDYEALAREVILSEYRDSRDAAGIL
ncbi:MAG: hypothetical protein U9R72_11085 [Chloroflexota bacterium]|nr:hypothetical protein [Chloroflexota bacterium]